MGAKWGVQGKKEEGDGISLMGYDILSRPKIGISKMNGGFAPPAIRKSKQALEEKRTLPMDVTPWVIRGRCKHWKIY